VKNLHARIPKNETKFKQCGSPGQIVKTKQGLVQGITGPSGANMFFGIPFAQPPQRWTAPVDPLSYSGV